MNFIEAVEAAEAGKVVSAWSSLRGRGIELRADIGNYIKTRSLNVEGWTDWKPISNALIISYTKLDWHVVKEKPEADDNPSLFTIWKEYHEAHHQQIANYFEAKIAESKEKPEAMPDLSLQSRIYQKQRESEALLRWSQLEERLQSLEGSRSELLRRVANLEMPMQIKQSEADSSELKS